MKMDKSETDKQAAMRQAEKERYLAKLKSRELERNKTKVQSKKAEQTRTQSAAMDAQTFLYRMGSRSEFRAGLREKMIADVQQNQQIMDKLGQVYRGKLKGFASRYLVKPQDLDKDLE
jgi:hypothetical protein